jgi:hypothetical protein
MVAKSKAKQIGRLAAAPGRSRVNAADNYGVGRKSNPA